jgi:hypothetical protein
VDYPKGSPSPFTQNANERVVGLRWLDYSAVGLTGIAPFNDPDIAVGYGPQGSDGCLETVATLRCRITFVALLH